MYKLVVVDLATSPLNTPTYCYLRLFYTYLIFLYNVIDFKDFFTQ